MRSVQHSIHQQAAPPVRQAIGKHAIKPVKGIGLGDIDPILQGQAEGADGETVPNPSLVILEGGKAPLVQRQCAHLLPPIKASNDLYFSINDLLYGPYFLLCKQRLKAVRTVQHGSDFQ